MDEDHNNTSSAVEEESMTLEEFMRDEDEMMKEAEALLGGIDEDACSYPEGYLPRQPLYSCKTCAEASGQLAGICYACSLHCHDGHDLIELYTKRNFCCDCGNSRFKDIKCKLFEEKIQVNALNVYTDNFKGLYCVCKKPYPPEEDSEELKGEEMHQCVVCEDWFHLSHIAPGKSIEELSAAANRGEYAEIICTECANRLPFLAMYQTVATDTPESVCKLTSITENEQANPRSQPLFMAQGWRANLCRCAGCIGLYERGRCTFLIEVEDSMESYDGKRQEKMAKEETKGNLTTQMYEIVMTQTKSHDAALFAVMATKQMEEHLGKFLQSHFQSGATLTKEDVERCFEELKSKRLKPDDLLSLPDNNAFEPM